MSPSKKVRSINDDAECCASPCKPKHKHHHKKKTHHKKDCHCFVSHKNGYEGRSAELIFHRDFKKKWNPDEFNFIFGADGVETQNATGLTVTSVPFTSTIPLGNEHVKWLKFYKNPAVLPCGKEIIFELKMSMAQSIDPNTIPSLMLPRIRNIREDIRLCSAAFNVVDPQTWMVFDFLLADDAIYAFYERLPFGKPAFGGSMTDYAAFSNAIMVRKRNGSDPINDIVRLGIGLNRDREEVNWFINGELVFTYNLCGINLPDEFRVLNVGGTPGKVFPTQAFCGFGTFSLLDMALPYNYARQMVGTSGSEINIAESALVQLDVDAHYNELLPGLNGDGRALVDPNLTFAYNLNDFPNDNLAIKLFGQGARMLVQELKIYEATDYCGMLVNNKLQCKKDIIH